MIYLVRVILRVTFPVVLVLSLLLAGCNRDPKVLRDKCIASGNRFFQNKKYKEASLFYRRALQVDSKSEIGRAHV